MLQVPLVVVLGHSGCGAVGAAAQGVPLGGRLPRLVDHLLPALERVKDSPGDVQDNAARANARRVAAELSESEPYLAERVRAGTLRVLPMFYALESGLVELLD
jgi:carbonic anhydrase